MAVLLHSPLALLIAQLVVIIAVARLLGLLARRAQQPTVVAEMIAGILLGPSLLGLLAPNIEDALFPRSSLAVLSLLSQLGLILFMFLIGLETDLRLLRGRGTTSVVISHASIVVPFVLGALLANFLDPALAVPGVASSSFTLFLGAAMSVTAFPVLARILSERRLLRTRVGAITVTCAAVDDVTAWCILAFVVASVRQTAVGEAVWITAMAGVYTLVMIFAVRPFLARLAARGGDHDGLTENAVALTFILLFLSAGATELIGIHALFGAFLMGAIIPRHGGFARALAEKIEDVVVIVLLPVFFALSGLRTEIGLLDSTAAWLQCGLIVLVACLGKFGGSFVAARFTGLGWREAGALGVLMNTRGLMELIVLNIGLELGVLSPTLFTMMVLMALFTTLITTPVLQLVYPPEALARDLLDPPHEPPPTATPDAPELRLLLCVALDRSGPGMALLARALVGPTQGPARLYALQLVRPAERTSDILDQTDEGAALTPLLKHGHAQGLDLRPLSFVSSEPARDICSVAEVKDVDLVLLGSHKPLLGQPILGGTVHEVMTAARTDVGVLLNRDLGDIRRVLALLEASAHDPAILALATRMARAGAHVTVLRGPTTADLPSADLTTADLTTADLTTADLTGLTVHLLDPTAPHEQLITAAAEHDLVLLPVTTPASLLHRCPRSVLLLHHHPRSADEPRRREPRAVAPRTADA